MLKARFMRQDFFQFSPTHKMQLLTNHKPYINGQDYGIWRRVVLLPYDIRFGSEADVADGRAQHVKDLRLIERLHGEFEGILAWAVRGAVRWYSAGLNPPERIQAAGKEYQSEQDRIAQFVREECDVGTDYEETFSNSSGGLYQRYSEWCKASGYRPLAKNRFSGELKRVVPGCARRDRKIKEGNKRRDIVIISGIRLKPDDLSLSAMSG